MLAYIPRNFPEIEEGRTGSAAGPPAGDEAYLKD
jgi:hypothetical protein